jgi:pimeloyl-ACP methyl ester carboxylesterase
MFNSCENSMHNTFTRAAWLIGISGVALAFAVAAHAQIALAPAYPATPQFGPEKAIGAVIWIHGHSEAEDSASPTPPYVWNLHQGGWDTYRFDRLRDGDTLPASTHRLVEEVNQLKQEGYRKVALAGQSFGAFIALMAAGESSKIDAVIATAPAAFGNFSEYYDSWRLNAVRLYPLLERIQTAQVVLFFFHGDDFDPGGRGDASSNALARRGVPFAVFDQPRELTEHWAAGTEQFAQRCGGYITGFLNNSLEPNDGAECQDGWSGPPGPVVLPAQQASIGRLER